MPSSPISLLPHGIDTNANATKAEIWPKSAILIPI
uniref:Uncharacterized protein n=1 Tax=Fagus sylvatica TaxID=28930 RepID=A0A2N9FEP6_FAGSY